MKFATVLNEASHVRWWWRVFVVSKDPSMHKLLTAFCLFSPNTFNQFTSHTTPLEFVAQFMSKSLSAHIIFSLRTVFCNSSIKNQPKSSYQLSESVGKHSPIRLSGRAEGTRCDTQKEWPNSESKPNGNDSYYER